MAKRIKELDMNKNILLGVSGGIAAYKAIELASLLSKAGFSVKTVLTDNAQNFVAGINFAAITHGSVHSSLFEDADPIPHITLADWADLIVVAPATAGSVPTDHSGLAVVTCSFSQVELRATRITRTDSTRSHPSLVVGVVLVARWLVAVV